MRIIDTHLHLWDLDKISLPWLNGEGEVLNRSYLLNDYEKQIGHNEGYEIVGAIYVEVDSAPIDREKENQYAIDICKDSSTPVLGVVLSGELKTSEFKKYMKPYLEKNEVKGIRQVLHVPSANPKTCLMTDFIENVRFLGGQGLIFEGCLRNEELGDLFILAESCPETTIVLDHMGIVVPENIAEKNPTNEQKLYRSNWENNLKKLASLNNVFCKISGLNPTRDWDVDTLRPSVDCALDIFGEDRVMFASNYPVCNISTGINPWINALMEITESRGEDFQKKLFYDNARNVYKL